MNRSEQAKANGAAYTRRFEMGLPSWTEVALAYEKTTGKKLTSVRCRQICQEAEVKIATAARVHGLLEYL